MNVVRNVARSGRGENFGRGCFGKRPRTSLTITTIALQDGWTPVHIAAQNGHLEIVGLLLQKGANKDAASNVGHTAHEYRTWLAFDLVSKQI
jgi:hypothetical protein